MAEACGGMEESRFPGKFHVEGCPGFRISSVGTNLSGLRARGGGLAVHVLFSPVSVRLSTRGEKLTVQRERAVCRQDRGCISRFLASVPACKLWCCPPTRCHPRVKGRGAARREPCHHRGRDKALQRLRQRIAAICSPSLEDPCPSWLSCIQKGRSLIAADFHDTPRWRSGTRWARQGHPSPGTRIQHWSQWRSKLP